MAVEGPDLLNVASYATKQEKLNFKKKKIFWGGGAIYDIQVLGGTSLQRTNWGLSHVEI